MRGGEPYLREIGVLHVSRSAYMVRYPRGSYLLLSLSSGHTRKQINSFDAVIHTPERPPLKRFLVSIGCSSPVMRHRTVLRAWCKQCLRGRSKTRRAPSRHYRDARVYGHTATAMHGNPRRAKPYSAKDTDPVEVMSTIWSNLPVTSFRENSEQFPKWSELGLGLKFNHSSTVAEWGQCT